MSRGSKGMPLHFMAVHLGEWMQFGYEITSDGSTQAFVTNTFSVAST